MSRDNGCTMPDDVFRGARFSDLAYQKFEDFDQKKAEIREAARLLGYDQVDFCWNRETDAQAFIAYDTKHSRAFVAFRGSEPTFKDWLTNLDARPGEIKAVYGPGVFVHRGYHRSVESVMPQIRESLEAHKPRSVFVGGHSQGGGDAQLASVQLASGANPVKVQGIYLYEAPPVSDGPGLSQRYRELGIHVTRVEQKIDMVPRLDSAPNAALYESLKPPLGHQDHAAANRELLAGALLGGEATRKSLDPYAGKLEGDYYYINSDDKVWHNPSPLAVVADRAKAAEQWASIEAVHLFDAHRPHQFAPIANHSEYGRNLFRATSREFQAQWVGKLADDRRLVDNQTVDRPLFTDLPPTRLAELDARRAAIGREEGAIFPRSEVASMDANLAHAAPLDSHSASTGLSHHNPMPGLIDLAKALLQGNRGPSPATAKAEPKKSADLVLDVPHGLSSSRPGGISP